MTVDLEAWKAKAIHRQGVINKLLDDIRVVSSERDRLRAHADAMATCLESMAGQFPSAGEAAAHYRENGKVGHGKTDC